MIVYTANEFVPLGCTIPENGGIYTFLPPVVGEYIGSRVGAAISVAVVDGDDVGDSIIIRYDMVGHCVFATTVGDSISAAFVWAGISSTGDSVSSVVGADVSKGIPPVRARGRVWGKLGIEIS